MSTSDPSPDGRRRGKLRPARFRSLAGRAKRPQREPGQEPQGQDTTTQPWWRRLGRKGWTALIAGTALVLAAAVSYVVPKLIDYWRYPMDVGIVTNQDHIRTKSGPAGGAYYFNDIISAVPRAPMDTNDCANRYAWALSHGGSTAESTLTRVTLKAVNETGVEITGIEPRIVSHKAAPLGSVVTCPGRGEAPSVRSIDIGLDTPVPTVITTDDKGAPIPFAFTLKSGDSEVFDISAHSINCDCQWEAVVKLRAGGREWEAVIRDGDKPFRTVGSVNAKRYEWLDHAWREPSGVGIPTPPVPASVDPCTLLKPKQVIAVLGVPPSGTQRTDLGGTGAAGLPTARTLCSFTSTAKGATKALTLDLTELTSVVDAHKEFADLVTKFRVNPGASRATTAPLGDESAVSGGSVVARKGARILTGYVQGLPGEDTIAEDAVRLALSQLP